MTELCAGCHSPGRACSLALCAVTATRHYQQQRVHLFLITKQHEHTLKISHLSAFPPSSHSRLQSSYPGTAKELLLLSSLSPVLTLLTFTLMLPAGEMHLHRVLTLLAFTCRLQNGQKVLAQELGSLLCALEKITDPPLPPHCHSSPSSPLS